MFQEDECEKCRMNIKREGAPAVLYIQCLNIVLIFKEIDITGKILTNKKRGWWYSGKNSKHYGSGTQLPQYRYPAAPIQFYVIIYGPYFEYL